MQFNSHTNPMGRHNLSEHKLERLSVGVTNGAIIDSNEFHTILKIDTEGRRYLLYLDRSDTEFLITSLQDKLALFPK